MGIINKIKSLLRFRSTMEYMNQKLLAEIRVDNLKSCLVSCAEQGVLQNHRAIEVIISLTSYGNRIRYVYLAIESIMQSIVKPDRIVLWLAEDEKDREIPTTLQIQMKRGLEIRYYKDIRSYKKLIPALREFPEAIIVTIDDDMIYDVDFLDNMLCSYRQHPDCIIANRTHKIVCGPDGRPVSYLNWNWWSYDSQPSHLNFLTGCGGVLYPPHCLDTEVFNEDAFMLLCPTADDVWFNAMAVKRRTRVFHSLQSKCFELQSSAITSLSSQNNDAADCQNDVQVKAVYGKYDLFSLLK